jgi:Zn-dependent protease/CBS domain-containing protein
MAAPQEDASTLSGSAALFTFRGIRVYLHWSFLLLVGYVTYAGVASGADMRGILTMIGLVLMVFACVVLHEFGHALTAQRFGINTRDITLLPIGGMASLERMPEEPRKEFWITVAGPAVNLVIMMLGYTALLLLGDRVELPEDPEQLMRPTDLGGVLLVLVVVNQWLFLFNLIPAFPMDGGRILRSLLGMFLPRERATSIAAGLGRVFAVLFVVAAFLMRHPFLALIGVFIYFAAGAEARLVKQQTALSGVRVRDVMRTRFWSMPAEATVAQAVEELLSGGDSDMLVMDGERCIGVLTRSDLVRALGQERKQAPLSALGPRPVPTASPGDDAQPRYMDMVQGRHALVPVVEHGRVVGVLEPENLAEYLLVRGAQQGRA